MEPEEVLAQLENWPSDDEEYEDTSSSGLSEDESDMLPSSEEEMFDNKQDGDLNSPSSQSSDAWDPPAEEDSGTDSGNSGKGGSDEGEDFGGGRGRAANRGGRRRA